MKKMKIDQAIEILKELKENNSHYAKAIDTVLEHINKIESLYESACEELYGDYS